MNKLLIIMIALFIVGCSSAPPKVRTVTEYKEVITPVSNIPIPPSTDCPTDAVFEIDRAASDGEIVKAYRIAVLQLRDCSEAREMVIERIRELGKKDATNIANLKTNGPVSIGAPVPDGPFGSSAPVVNIESDLDRALREFDEAIDAAAETLKTKVSDKYKQQANTAGPVSAAPVVSPTNDNVVIEGNFEFPEDELARDLGLLPSGSSAPFGSAAPVTEKSDNTFGDIEQEFSNLSSKKYDIE